MCFGVSVAARSSNGHRQRTLRLCTCHKVGSKSGRAFCKPSHKGLIDPSNTRRALLGSKCSCWLGIGGAQLKVGGLTRWPHQQPLSRHRSPENSSFSRLRRVTLIRGGAARAGGAAQAHGMRAIDLIDTPPRSIDPWTDTPPHIPTHPNNPPQGNAQQGVGRTRAPSWQWWSPSDPPFPVAPARIRRTTPTHRHPQPQLQVSASFESGHAINFGWRTPDGVADALA